MKRIAIIGGGISGLGAAFYLEQHRRQGAQLEYLLFEKSHRLGGTLLTELIEGCVVEAGPDSFLTEKAWATKLCRELGIADQLIGSNDSQRKTYIFLKNKLVPMPDGLMFLVPTKVLPTVLSPLFSASTKLRIARECFHLPRSVLKDESVAALVERHYGREVVERLADPLLAAVYGGEANELSVRATLPRLAEMEARHGSLGRGMLSACKRAQQKANTAPLFTSLKNGMQQMVDALIAKLPQDCLRTSTNIRKLTTQSDAWVLWLQDGTPERFDALILAVPSPVAGALLEPADRDLSSELRQITYTSSITVALGYERSAINLPPGFGFLVPRSEEKHMLACTFVHNKFPHRATADRALLRCFFGGTEVEHLLSLRDDDLVALVCEELLEMLNLTAEPLFARVYRWKGAMAQYAVGHLERLERIEQRRQQLPGLSLAGNAYRGIGVPDCVRSGMDAATQAAGSAAVTAVTTPFRIP